MATTSKFNKGDALTYTAKWGATVRDIIFVAYKDADIAEVRYKGDRYTLLLSHLSLQKPKVELRRIFEEDKDYVIT